MLTNAQNKYIRSLSQQKFRNEYKVFIVEGEKLAGEWMRSDRRIQMVVATEDWVGHNTALISHHGEAQLCITTESGLEAVSGLQTPNKVLLVVEAPEAQEMKLGNEWCIALEDIQDPGNMGTIIRIADWFGIGHVICSPGCVNVYNPKVVQSAMGGHLRVQIHNADLVTFVSESPLVKYAATLDGQDIYKCERASSGILIIGNESKGISPQIAGLADKRITIPRRGGAESLNAGVSAGILCALLLPC
jgi:RNA methyltransferase, TrmH family